MSNTPTPEQSLAFVKVSASVWLSLRTKRFRFNSSFRNVTFRKNKSDSDISRTVLYSTSKPLTALTGWFGDLWVVWKRKCGAAGERGSATPTGHTSDLFNSYSAVTFCVMDKKNFTRWRVMTFKWKRKERGVTCVNKKEF